MSRDILETIAPDVANLSAASQALSLAETLVGEVFGDLRHIAIAYRAAHMLTVASIGGSAGGPVTSEKEGDLARSYGTSTGGASLGSTSYGREYEALRRQVIFSARNRLI